ncbi:toxin YoeB [Arcicella aurantiaca]|uniref:Putative mRNA interferase YoeB n=1 Tax=Arcicella aurantiaca TaxID=591202 RepID=A0A316EEK7_9BACT|nr:Txe/YoeB family addiction module toxin [Arcicella aurantiaca]PWK29456.1 toxin YoeB [Arcicella aurantiaca]
MEIEFSDDAIDHLAFFKKSGQSSILKKIRKLLESIQETPTEGIGKPEALKYSLSGFWSRRIDRENRIVYKVVEETIWVYSLKGHYE